MTPTTYQLAFFICHSKNDGPRIVSRRPEGDARTQMDGFLNAFVYQCRSPDEFKRLSMDKDCGARAGMYAVVMVVGSDGSKRYPGPTDTISPPSPVAAADAPDKGQGVVSLSSPDAAGDPPSASDPMALTLEKLRTMIRDAVKPVRCDRAAAALGVDKGALREAIEAPGSGVLFKPPFGWLSLTGEDLLA